MNLEYIVRLAYTHPENEGKSIRFIARQIGLNPGYFYRFLKQLDLVFPQDPARSEETPETPFHPAPNAQLSRSPETKKRKKIPPETGKPLTHPLLSKIERQLQDMRDLDESGL